MSVWTDLFFRGFLSGSAVCSCIGTGLSVPGDAAEGDRKKKEAWTGSPGGIPAFSWHHPYMEAGF